jgi:hypothetical protein
MAYGTDAGFQEWLTAQGYTLPANAPALAVLRSRGSTYIDGYDAYWTGYRTGGVSQELGWPRSGASLNCKVAIDSNVIPLAVINAAYRAAWLEGETPGILAGSVAGPGKRVRRNNVDGAVEREYFDDGKAQVGGGPFIDSQIDGALRQFICDATGSAFVWSLGS